MKEGDGPTHKMMKRKARDFGEGTSSGKKASKKRKLPQGTYQGGTLKKSLHGNRYQLMLLMLFAWRGRVRNYQFKLATEMVEAGFFDDIVLYYLNSKGRVCCCFLQAKHKQKQLEKFSADELLSEDYNEPLSILKYFRSYYTIKRKYFFSKIKLRNFVISFNIELDTESLKHEKMYLKKVKEADPLDRDIFSQIAKRYKLVISKDHKLYEILRKASDVYVLAKELSEHILNDSKLTLSRQIFKTYHVALVREKIISLPNKKWHQDFINNQGLSDPAKKLRETLLKISPQNTFQELLNKKLKLSKTFGKTPDNESYLDLPSDDIEDSEIKIFLEKRLVLAVTPEEQKLKEFICEEIGNEFNLVDAGFITNDFQTKMFDWFAEKQGPDNRYLSHDDIGGFFEEIKNRLHRSYLTYLTMEFKQEMKQLELTFEKIPEELQEFLSPTETSPLRNNKQIFKLVTSQISFSLAKIFQILEGYDSYKKGGSYISVSLKNLLSTKDCEKAFDLQGTNLLILKCNPESTEEEMQNVYKNLSGILRKEKEKKIVIVFEEGNPFPSKFLSTCEVINDSINFGDLKETSQSKLLNKLVTFQRTKVPLKRFIDVAHAQNIIDSDTLIKLINGEEIPIGEELMGKPLSNISNYYISRKFHKVKIKNSIIDDKKFRRRLRYTKEKFDERCRKKPGENIHWLNDESKRLIWMNSSSSAVELRKYMTHESDSDDIQINFYSESDLLDYIFGLKAVIISDVAGMGKSTVLTSLSQKIIKKEPPFWIVRINLEEHFKVWNKLKNDQTDLNDKNKALDFLLNDLLNLTSSLEKNLLIHSFHSKNEIKVVVLFDSFDEICPDYKDIFLNFLHGLKETKVDKLWLTTRPHMKEDLESELGVFAYELKPFSKDGDQKKFLIKYWAQKLNIKRSQIYGKMEKYATALIDLFVSSTRGEETEFTGIPLHAGMVADVFYENRVKQSNAWQGCKEFIAANDEEPVLPEQLNLVQLYERFMKTKFDLYLEEKCKINPSNPKNVRVYKKKYQKWLKQRQMLALYYLLNSEDFRKVSPDPDAINAILEEVDTENDGIVDLNEDKKPRFSHQTYAEYLASFPFTEKILNYFTETLECFNRVLLKTSKIFINSIIRQLEPEKNRIFNFTSSKPLVNFASMKGYSSLTLALLEAHLDNWPEPDPLKKAPLHYAAEYGLDDVVNDLLNYYDDVSEEEMFEHGKFKKDEYKNSKLVECVNKEDMGGNTAVYHAAKNSHFDICYSLLLKGADCEKLKEYTRLIVSKVISRITSVFPGTYHPFKPLVEKLLRQEPKVISELSSDNFLVVLAYFFMHGRIKVIKHVLNPFSSEKIKEILNTEVRNQFPLDLVNHSEVLTDDERLIITKYILDNGGEKTRYSARDESRDLLFNKHITRVLLFAVKYGHIKTFKFFLSLDEHNFGMYLNHAFHYNCFEIIDYLRKKDITLTEGAGTVLIDAVRNGANLRSIKYLIDHKIAENINASDSNGETPIFCAMRRRFCVVQYLKDAGAKVNYEVGKQPLDFAMKLENTEPEANPDIVHIIKYLLLDCEAKISESVKNQAEYFKAHNFDLNFIDENGKSRLHKAIESNNIDLSTFIIRKIDDVNIKDKKGKTPLHWACMLECTEIIRLLFQKGAMYDVVDDNLMKPYDYLSRNQPFNVEKAKISWLLKTFNLLFSSDNLMDAFKTRLEKETHVYDKYLYHYFNDFDWGPYDTGDYESINNPIFLILNGRNAQGKLLLHLAAATNQKEAIEKFLWLNRIYLNEKGKQIKEYMNYHSMPIDAVDNEGNMPIHLAAEGNHSEIVCLLLKEGTIFNAKNGRRSTPEKLAKKDNTLQSLLQSIKKLFNFVKQGNERDANSYITADSVRRCVNARQQDGKTMLHIAASFGKCNIVQRLLNFNADINSLDLNHFTPLHYAVENNRMDVVKLLLQKRAIFNIENKKSKTPFELATNECTELLLSIRTFFLDVQSEEPKRGVNNQSLKIIAEKYNITLETIINIQDGEGNTLLSYAAENGYLDMIELLLQHGAIFNMKNKADKTPLDLTKTITTFDLLESIQRIFDDPILIFNKIVSFQVIKNVQNDEGKTLLHVATKEGNESVVKALLKAGANINAKDFDGKKAFDYAQLDNIKQILVGGMTELNFLR